MNQEPLLLLIDSHCHLEELENLAGAIERAKSVGLIAIVAVGSDYESNSKVLEIAAKYSGFVFAALGVHPGRLGASPLGQNLKFIEDHIGEIRAIGEIGLDYHKKVIEIAPKERQKSALPEILAVAKRYRKPAIVHSRYAWQDTLTIVKEAGIEKAVFHWYTGPSRVLKNILDLGYFISATPAVAYHPEHRRAVKAAPLDSLLLETDSPVSYGTGFRWQAEPADTLRTLKAVAEARGISEQETAQATTSNAIRLFGLPFVGQ